MLRSLRSWANAPLEIAKRRCVSDIQSEFSLREREPPIELDDLNIALKAAAQIFDDLPDERREQIGAELLSEYKEAQKNRTCGAKEAWFSAARRWRPR